MATKNTVTFRAVFSAKKNPPEEETLTRLCNEGREVARALNTVRARQALTKEESKAAAWYLWLARSADPFRWASKADVVRAIISEASRMGDNHRGER